MKKLNQVVVALMAVGMLGGTVMPAVTASAASTGYSRINKWHGIRHEKYKVANTKGKTYTITGPAKNVKLKANHYLKNYKKTTWIRSGITQVEHNGNWMVYYYVKPITKKKHTGGWVKLTDVKPFKSHKADKYHAADFDTWYRSLNQHRKNGYMKDVLSGGATDSLGDPEQDAANTLD